MVIVGGANIYPAEIESVLLGMPGVRDCAVFGVPDDDYGEALLALVEPCEDILLTVSSIQDFLEGRLKGFKLPRRIEIRRDLPRQDSGKIFKRALRAPYWEGVGRHI
jgi:long-chain acyl-CoA synthetase